MTPDEVKQVLLANIGKTVHVGYRDGDKESVFVHNVDDEGFVCDVVSPEDKTYPPEQAAWWTRLEDVREVIA